MNPLPKKILRIQELTFILPDDFTGTVSDAMVQFLEYRNTYREKATYMDPEGTSSTLEILVNSDNSPRVCGDAAIYELVDEEYRLIDATNPYLEDMHHKEKL